MLSIITLELINSVSSSDRKNEFNRSQPSEVEQELSKIKEEWIENFCILLPPAVTLLGIILMSILYKIFM